MVINFWADSIHGRGQPDALDSFGLHNSQAGRPIEDADGWQRITNERLFRGGWPIITDMTPLSTPVAVARVNHNGWSARCPYGCGGSEYVDSRFPLFYCHSCRNQGQRRALKVTFPAQIQAGAIEAALLARPLARNRNWEPGETVSFLTGENRAHGLEG